MDTSGRRTPAGARLSILEPLALETASSGAKIDLKKLLRISRGHGENFWRSIAPGFREGFSLMACLSS
jgi:hypothetical protein